MRRALPPILIAIAFFALALVWIITDRRASQRVYDTYSSANTSDSGLSLAAGYLAKQRKVGMLTKSLARQPVEANAVIFRVAKESPLFFDLEDLDEKQVGPPAPKQKPILSDAEDAFVRGGGRVILAAREGLFGMGSTDEKVVQKVFPIWPAVKTIEVAPCDCDGKLWGFAELRPRMHAILTAGWVVILARERIGSGELFVLSTPDILANKSLGNGSHLALLAALAGDERPVYFDEVLHGIVSDDGSVALMKEWNLGPFLLLLGAIAVLLFWRHGTRIGQPDEDYREARSDAIDLVRSLGALYHEVTKDGESIALYHEALTKTVAHQTGLRGEALRKRVDDLTAGLVPTHGTGKMPDVVFAKQLEAINNGFEGISKSQSRRVSKRKVANAL